MLHGCARRTKRVVHGAVTVRVILLQTFADHTGALHVLAVVEHAHVLHGVENAAMHGLEPVANFGERAADDDRHRIVEIRAAHLLFNVDGLNVRCARTLSVAAQGKLWILWFVCHKKEALGFQLLAVSYYVFSSRSAHNSGKPVGFLRSRLDCRKCLHLQEFMRRMSNYNYTIQEGKIGSRERLYALIPRPDKWRDSNSLRKRFLANLGAGL